MTTLIAFLLTLAILIAVHEYGHYRMAVACNVRVLCFSIGFGRVVYSRRIGRDGCEFAVSALPLGGYVRMLDEREAEVAPGERERAFNRRPLWQRSAIVAAGPAANLLLAVLLYAGVHWIGLEEPKAVLSSPPAGSVADRAGLRAGDWVRATARADGDWRDVRSLPDLRWRVTQAALAGEPLRLMVSDREGRGSRALTLELGRLGPAAADASTLAQAGIGAPFSQAVVGEVKAGGPAERAGLRKGDRVLRIDGSPVADAQDLRERIRASNRGAQAVPSTWVVEREGRSLELLVQPRAAEVREGAVVRVVGRIDAYLGRPPEMVEVRRGLWEGLALGAERTWEVSALTLRTLGAMLVGQASLSNLSGPLTIADVAGQTAERGLTHYLAFLALVSVSLGVFIAINGNSIAYFDELQKQLFLHKSKTITAQIVRAKDTLELKINVTFFTPRVAVGKA
ncbi:MAG: RIP metalloprotease RseP, partial [Rubrivivax sp.]